MAATYALTSVTRDVTANRRVLGTLTASGTYTNPGGDAVAPSVFQMTVLKELLFNPASNATSGLVPYWNKATGKIQLFTASGTPAAGTPLVELANGTSVAGFILECEAIGR
jgi:hypothetical protein